MFEVLWGFSSQEDIKPLATWIGLYCCVLWPNVFFQRILEQIQRGMR